MAADVHKFLSVGNPGQSPAVFVFELLEFVILVVCLMSPLLIGVLEMADLAVHFRALNFNGLNLSFKVGFVATLVSALVSLCNCIFSKSTSFEIFFVEESLGSSALIIETQVQLGPKSIR